MRELQQESSGRQPALRREAGRVGAGPGGELAGIPPGLEMHPGLLGQLHPLRFCDGVPLLLTRVLWLHQQDQRPFVGMRRYCRPHSLCPQLRL